MAPKLEFDPERLLALDRKRTSVRALIRGLSDEYQNLRERRQDVQRRAAMTRSKSEYSDPRSRAGYTDQADMADVEAADLARQMSDIQGRMDDLAEDASAASAVATSALKFAIAQNMAIPPELRDRANEITGSVHPVGIDTAGVAKWL